MREDIKIASKCSVRYYISAVFALFIWFSIMAISTMSFTVPNGYTAYNAETNEVLYHYYYEDGEDLQKAQYEAQGITVSTVELRSLIEGTTKIVIDTIAQLFSLLIFVMFIHKIMWRTGDSDANLSDFNHSTASKWRGAKIGALAVIPSFIVWLLVVLSKAGLINGNWYTVFRLMSFQSFTLVHTIFGNTASDISTFSWIQIFLGLTVLLVLPIVSQISYFSGTKHFNLTEKLIYKKGRKI